MNIAIWAIQGILGLLFILSGTMKVIMPPERIQDRMTFVRVYPLPFVRFIGAAEVLGGLGLILPGATGILSWLTPVAALGLAIIMAGAVYYHLRYNERNQTPSVAILLLLTVAVIVGRVVVAPF